ncbi:hypothetical protein CKO11_05130 [Rhodobacter sp. TJ_12]|uniref:hypothetical protein n=1 Tax=Rhodobacter sp. TJ_12 TaxID=2029399 RepID=UPI001CC1B33B|nr:hypothetical protein [Rhodobacter sp. TJ_12]MBZ4021843.1 hypothetical protein [Rhodobacter sp. TJ_12]
MKQIFGAALAALAFAGGPAGADSFADHPVDIYTGQAVMPDFAGAQSAYSMFRTRLGEAAQGGANYAGNYVLYEMGCGTGCVMAFVIDLTSGAIMDAPVSGERQLNARYYYRADSALLKTTWIEGPWDTGICMIGEWTLDARGFHLISTTRHVPLEDCQS